MNALRSFLRPAALPLAAMAIALALPGCYNPFQPPLASTLTNSRPAPLPNSPTGVVDLFQWCWVNRAYDQYQDIFTDNYRFEFASGDSAGTYYSATPWTRSDELTTAQHIFITGTPSQPPATSVTLTFTQDLSVDPDPRDGKRDTTYHRQITALVQLRVFFAESGYEVKGPVYFNVIRGDSAIIPPPLVARGFKPDPNRWYIERWVDGTLNTSSAIPTPTLNRAGRARAAPAGGAPPGREAPPSLPVEIPTTWGAIKVLWGP